MDGWMDVCVCVVPCVWDGDGFLTWGRGWVGGVVEGE